MVFMFVFVIFFFFVLYVCLFLCFFFFFKQKTAYEISACLVGSEMCIRDRECCVTRIQKKNEGYTVRVITKEIWKDYKSISPSLEDLYLNDFEDEQLWI